MRNKSWLAGCLILLVLLLVGGGIAAWFLVPEVDEQLPIAMGQTFVTLTTPTNGAGIPLNAITTIEAQAISAQPIRTLELWIDGVPAQSKSAPAGASLNQFFAAWSWMPTVEGEHALLVRAVGDNQQTTTSNVVRVVASKEANLQIIVPHPVKPGETLPGIAGQYHVTPQEIVDVNPGMSGNAVTPGTNINVPAEPLPPDVSGDTGVVTDPPAQDDPVTPEEEAEPPTNKFPGKHGIWIGNIWGSLFKPTPPTAPKIKAKAIPGKCDVDIFISDKSSNETGFMIYRLDSHAHAFQHIATLDANGDASLHFVDKKVYGKFQYYVAAFNSAGKSESNLVKAMVTDAQCHTPAWQHIGLDKTTVTVSQTVDKMYCYLSVNNGPWVRVPPGDDDFLPVHNGQVDLSQFIKKLAPPDAQGNVTVRLECWAWRGSTLVFLGEASTTINSGQANQPIQFGNANYRVIASVINSQIDLSGLGTLPFGGGSPTPPSPWIDPPTNAQFSMDADVCAKHGVSSLICTLVVKTMGAGVFLTWDWKDKICIREPNGSDKCAQEIHDIDGYHVYRTFPGPNVTPELIATSGDPKITMTIVTLDQLKTPPGAFTAPQFFVRAFKGEIESDDSKLVIAPDVDSIMEEIAQAVQSAAQSSQSTANPPKTPLSDYRSFVYHKTGATWGALNSMGMGADEKFAMLQANEVVVGFDHILESSGWVGSQYSNRAYRGAVRFDLSELKNQNFTEATLSFRLRTGKFSTNTLATNQVPTCMTTILFAKEDWRATNYASMPPGDDYKSVPNSWGIGNPMALTMNENGVAVSNSQSFSVDVTSAVREWVQGTRPNYGFLFRGGDERYSVMDNNICWSIYGPFGLSVK
jgi:LysM repeat protein